MAVANAVATNLPTNFGQYVIATSGPVSLATTGNTVANLTVEASSYIVRRIVATANGSIASANVSILTSSDGATANAIANNITLSTVSASTKYQDLTLVSAATSTVYTAPALFLVVNTASGNSNAAVITVYGDPLTP